MLWWRAVSHAARTTHVSLSDEILNRSSSGPSHALGARGWGMAMIQCSECGHKNPAGTDFCTKCGAKTRLECDKCGFKSPPDSEFCGGCGELTEYGERMRLAERLVKEERQKKIALKRKIMVAYIVFALLLILAVTLWL